MNKKGFTLIELLGVIVLLAILLVFAVFSYSRYLKISKDKILNIDVSALEEATLNAFTDCSKNPTGNFCLTYDIPEPGQSKTVLYSDLVAGNYIDKFKDPYDKDVYCDDSSYVTVTRKAVNNLTGEADKSDISFEYIACLRCGRANSQARYSMAKIMKNKDISTADISTCTGLSTQDIDNIKKD